MKDSCKRYLTQIIKNNNCDSNVDSEDSLGCTNYYRDGDSDDYGVAADVRCLCAPDSLTHHTATLTGDCDDARQAVNPGVIEHCNTSLV